ncbi:MAG: hypothetical protein IPJ46_14770 [Anaerolineales bacterium]|nr:hypothetical protein [Anaerolineales bacterium]
MPAHIIDGRGVTHIQSDRAIACARENRQAGRTVPLTPKIEAPVTPPPVVESPGNSRCPEPPPSWLPYTQPIEM